MSVWAIVGVVWCVAIIIGLTIFLLARDPVDRVQVHVKLLPDNTRCAVLVNRRMPVAIDCEWGE